MSELSACFHTTGFLQTQPPLLIILKKSPCKTGPLVCSILYANMQVVHWLTTMSPIQPVSLVSHPSCVMPLLMWLSLLSSSFPSPSYQSHSAKPDTRLKNLVVQPSYVRPQTNSGSRCSCALLEMGIGFMSCEWGVLAIWSTCSRFVHWQARE
jgi:hypothetical protein